MQIGELFAGGLGLLFMLFLVVLAVLMFLMPFFVYGTNVRKKIGCQILISDYRNLINH